MSIYRQLYRPDATVYVADWALIIKYMSIYRQLYRPDATAFFAVDWALQIKYLSVYPSSKSPDDPPTQWRCAVGYPEQRRQQWANKAHQHLMT